MLEYTSERRCILLCKTDVMHNNNITGTYNLTNIYLITKRTSSRMWGVANNGNGSNIAPSQTNTTTVRPTINLASEVKILSGSGLPNNPFVVGL